MADLIPGTGTISKIYAGSSEVQKVYAGSTLVYEAGGAGASDWDTYADGIWQEIPNHASSTTYLSGGDYEYIGLELQAATQNTASWWDHVLGWWSYSGRPTAYMDGTQTDNDAPPYVAVWDATDQIWVGVAPYLATGSNRAIYFDGVTRLFNASPDSATNKCVFVSLTADPGDISGWRDYDGPDDWDTWADGIYKTISDSSTTNDIDEIEYGSQLGTGFRWFTSAVRVNGVDDSVAQPWLAVWFPAQVTGNGSTIATGFYELYQKSGTQNSAGNTDYDFVSRSDGGSKYPTNRLATVYYMPLRQEPNDITAWRDYDGEITPWESIDTNLQLYSSGNTWWNINQTINTWSRDGDVFGDLDYITHIGSNMILRINKGTRYTTMQDYIDEYGVPEIWVWIRGVKYVFDTFDQVTASGDLRLIGPAIALADFEDPGTGSNSLGWTSGDRVIAEFRPTWETFYPRVGFVAGQDSASAGRVYAHYKTGTAFDNISAGGTGGYLYPDEFVRASISVIELNTSSGSWDATSFRAEAPWAAWWRGSSIAWDKGPCVTTGIFKAGIRYEATYGSVDFNSFATNPVGMLLYSRDPGNVTKWADYDGPLWDWDTYQVQNYWDPAFDTNRTDYYRIPITQTVTGNTYGPASHASALTGYSNPINQAPGVGYFGNVTVGYSLLEPHCTLHYWNSSAGSGAYTSAGGWYTFGLPPTAPSGAGNVYYSELEFSSDPDGGFRAGTGKQTTIQTSTQHGEKAAYWRPPFPRDGLIAFLPFKQMGATYNYRTDAGGSMLVIGDGLEPDDPADYYFPFYAAVFSGNRILITFTGANRDANAAKFVNGAGGYGTTCTVRLRDGTATQTTIDIGTEYTYTGTLNTWVNAYSMIITLSNPSAGAPFNWTNHGDGVTEFLLPFPCAFRIEA